MQNKKSTLSRTARQTVGLFAILIIVMIFMTTQNSKFLSIYNLMSIVRQNVPNIIIAVAMAFVIISGSIDLSVGGVMALSAVVYGYLCLWGINPWLAIVIVMVLGVIIGWVNNFITETLKLPAIMATMSTWLICEGMALTICGAIPISDPLVKPITVLNKAKFFGGNIPLALFIILPIIAIFIFLEKKTLLGKYAISIGGNSHAAYFSGINVKRMRFIFFALCSVMAALSGVWQVARMGAADPKIGVGMEFNVISACVLGGVNIKGGEGSIIGVVIGTVLLAVLTNGMQMMDISSFYQQIITGMILLGAVLVNYLMESRLKNRMKFIKGKTVNE